MIATLTRFLQCNSGATAIEYGLIAAGIAAVVITSVQSLGTNTKAVFTKVGAAIK